jgi:hypothetical protein
MKKHLLLVTFCVVVALSSYSQATCTFAVSGNWDTRVCSETGVAPVSGDNLVIASGVVIVITTNSPSPKHTGDVYIDGELEINQPNININGNVIVRSGGLLEVNEKLDIGTNTPNCGKTLVIYSGGTVTFPDSSPSDKLQICDEEIARGGTGGCNAYPAGPPPYCQPSGGFTGPTGFDENGVNPLPVTLVYFETQNRDDERINIEWATAAEENFREFVIQRSSDGETFTDIATVPGQGRDIYLQINKYQFEDVSPLLGYNYYRLKAVDLDGTFELFKVRSTRVGGLRSVKVYPNPIRGNEITFALNFNPSEGDRIRIINSMGRELVNTVVSSSTGTFWTGDNFSPGIYFIQYSGADHKQTVRLFSY